MDVETLAALRTDEGRALLAEAVESYGAENTIALGSRLRRTHPAPLVAAAITQAELRHRALAKFDRADAERMFFTVDGLEQATRATVAAHRARRIRAAGNTEPVADLCCGIGGDLIALTRAGLTVTGMDDDPLTVAVALANVAELGVTAAVEYADVTTIDRSPFGGVTCDPSRRGARGRVFDPDAYRPPWTFVEELLTGTACVKVAPGIPHGLVPAGVEAEWVSDGGEVKEAALWSGKLAGEGVRRRATVLPSAATVTDADAPTGPAIREPGRWLVEPDGAVIRAGLVTAVAAEVGGWLIDPQIAYVSTDSVPDTRLGRAYEIVDRLPYDIKQLRAYVRARGIGALTIKKRGVGVQPETLRRQLRPRGTGAATIAVTRSAGRATVLVLSPLPPPPTR